MAKAVLLALVVLTLVPAAATGHAGETPGTDYRSTVRAAPAGLAVRMVGGDDRLLVTRTTAAEVVVLGYGGEPYLRLDEDGTWENRASPAVALNAERQPDAPLDGAAATPEWVRVGDGASAVFHDHRAHWMGSEPPAAVQADPDRPRDLFDWSVPLLVDGREAAITGDVAWLGRPRSALWWAAAALAAAVGLVAGLLVRERTVLATAAGAATAIACAGLVEASARLDLPAGGTEALIGVAIAVALTAAAVAGAWLTRRVPAYTATVLLLASVIVGAAPLMDAAGPAFAHALVPGPIPTVAVRLVIVVGIAGTALAAGATARALRDLLSTRPTAPARSSAW